MPPRIIKQLSFKQCCSTRMIYCLNMSGIASIFVILGLFLEQNVSLWVDERVREGLGVVYNHTIVTSD